MSNFTGTPGARETTTDRSEGTRRGPRGASRGDGAAAPPRRASAEAHRIRAPVARGRVLVVEDGPTITHGGMPYGAGYVAATGAEAAEIVDPRRSAVGEIAEVFPQAPIICHQVAIPHLAEPSRLWEGTKKVLGPMALSYGPIKPVAENRLQAADRFENESIKAIITPGHAAHHVSYQSEKYLFAGETGGVFIALPENRFYLRPATPPKFFLDEALQSVDALIAGGSQMICYGHYGVHPDAAKMLRIHRRQLQFWEQLLREIANRFAQADRVSGCLEQLLQEDKLMATFDQLPPDIQAREKYFLQNSITGYLGFIDSEG